MSEEQAYRIALGAAFIGLWPFISMAIKRFLGDNGHCDSSVRYTLGRMAGFFVRDARRLISAARRPGLRR